MASFAPCPQRVHRRHFGRWKVKRNRFAGVSKFSRVTALLLLACIPLGGCPSRHSLSSPSIEFTRVPHAGEGGPNKQDIIEGRVTQARPGQKIVLFARWGPWWVQPLTNQPFTTIQPDSTWRNSTHFGTAYAALLVDPEYQPRPTMDTLPSVGAGVIVVKTTKGRPVFWETWWFQLIVVTIVALAVLLFYRLRMLRRYRQLHIRFEERLGERTRIAQELHDTLLQGLISASMQLHVIADQMPADSAAKLKLGWVLGLTKQLIEEGRNAVGGLRSPRRGSSDLGESFCQIQQEFVGQNETDFSVIVEGTPRPLIPLIADDIYRIGREALTNAFRHSHADNIEVELEYASDGLRVLVRDSGMGFDPKLSQFGRDGHWGLSGMRERAKRIGARLRVLTRPGAGTEVELTVPGGISYVPVASRGSNWVGRLLPRRKSAIERSTSEQD